MKRFVLIILVFCIFIFNIFSDEDWYIGKPIKDFSFKGLETISPAELSPIVRPYIGKKFTLDLFWEIQNKLYALDYFESIESNAKPGDSEKNSVIVEFSVKERTTVEKIEIQGNNKIRASEILDKIVLKKGDMVSDTRIKDDEEAIKELYLGKGFTDIKVSGKSDVDKKTNRTNVIFEIVEGEQTTIKKINFSGNRFASESTLKGLMKTKAQSLFNNGVFQESKLQTDIQAIEDYYADHGYIDCKVVKVGREVKRDEKSGKRSMYLTLYIKEGEQYIYGGMTFEGNKIFSTKKLESLVRQQTGKILNKKKLNADFQRISDLYYENGYIENVIKLNEKRNEKTKAINYVVTIEEKDRAHIESIIFKGNKKTKDFVLYRELPFEVGDIFNKKKIIEGLRNIYNLQYFTTVNPETPQGSAAGLMDLVINVEETSTADINMGIQFSGTDFPVSGTVKWSERNFLGRGQTVGVNLVASPVKQNISFNFIEPWMFGYRWLGGVNFSFQHSNMQNVLQDILPPVYSDTENSDAVPDPYDGHYVFSQDTTYPASGGTAYKAGAAFPGIPTSADITDYNLKTDYQYAIQKGEKIPSQYKMNYNSYDISGGINTGYKYHTFLGWLGTSLGISSTLRFIHYDPSVYRPFDYNIRANLDRWSIVNKLDTNVYWDKRDYFLNPTNGFFLNQKVTFTGGFLLGDRHYIKTQSRADGYLTLFSIPVLENWNFKVVAAAHSALSLILPQFGNLFKTDFTDLLYIDGMNVARGWTSGYTPISYGKALWDNRFELRLPISEQFLWGVLFCDAASLWEEVQDMSSMKIDDFFFSIGTGLRFTIPQFPIRLYFSKGFQIKNGGISWKPGDLALGNFTFDFVISLGGDNF